MMAFNKSEKPMMRIPLLACLLAVSLLPADAATPPDLSITIDPEAHGYVVRNGGSPGGTEVRICSGDPVQATWECENVVMQPDAEIRRELSFVRGAHVVSVSSGESDSNPSNNSVTWLATDISLAMTLTPPVVRAGDAATLVLERIAPGALSSSRPPVASVAPLNGPVGQRFVSVPVNAVAPGFSRLTFEMDLERSALPIRVIAADDPLRAVPMVWLESDVAWRYGEETTIMAEVSGFTADGRMPSGTVTFLANGVPFGEAPVEHNRAYLSVTSLPPGLYDIAATYGGDTHFFDTESVSILEVGVDAYASFAARRNGSEVEITVDGAPGPPPTGTVLVARVGSSEWLTGTLTPVSNSTSAVSFTVPQSVTVVQVYYSGDSFYQPYSAETGISAGSPRRRGVRH